VGAKLQLLTELNKYLSKLNQFDDNINAFKTYLLAENQMFILTMLGYNKCFDSFRFAG